ncbi:unnamed protein product [Heligmosomoides polygyrus]|uniref:Uncharacterized protein n=1 Tax=Heligmosomoides polygyrus TaxID=6339 RepID=A0A3P7ULN4_HELPZ|nr:unnamed protein product [Heligmosomoides polygyrus]
MSGASKKDQQRQAGTTCTSKRHASEAALESWRRRGRDGRGLASRTTPGSPLF